MVGVEGLEPPTVPYLNTALARYKLASLPLSYTPRIFKEQYNYTAFFNVCTITKICSIAANLLCIYYILTL